jgi:hypothetical protein
MNPTLRRIFDFAVMLMWMVVGIIVPLSLSPELRAQIWVAIAIHLTLAAILWFGWWAEGKRTRSRAFSFATLWFIPFGSMNIAREPFWPWAQPLWPWLAIVAGLASVACICLSEQASAAEDKAAGKEPGPPVSKLRLALAFVCMIVWGLAVCYQGWPESLTQQLWAKLAINVIAVGSVWSFWFLNPESLRTRPKFRFYVLFSFVTVMALGVGISPWAWHNETLEFAFLGFILVFGLTHFVLDWRESRPAAS